MLVAAFLVFIMHLGFATLESGLTQAYETTTSERAGNGKGAAVVDADLILIAHPEHQRLGTRFRLHPGSSMEVGRAPTSEISLPEVLSISRQHAKLHYRGRRVVIEDLGSTNGTYVNGALIQEPTVLHSGDRFQVAGVHFKFLHEKDPEHAFHLTISDLVTRDGLTEIYNKRKYDEEADRLLRTPKGLYVGHMMQYSAVGTPPAVADYLERFAELADADELIIVPASPTLDTRLRSIELLAHERGLEPSTEVLPSIPDRALSRPRTP